jgi:hypothetical protein
MRSALAGQSARAVGERRVPTLPDAARWNAPDGRVEACPVEPTGVSRVLSQALEIRRTIEGLGLTIYDAFDVHPETVLSTDHLEALLRHELVGEVLDSPANRTRAKLGKQLVCRALGYEIPDAFRRTQPRIPAQDLDVFVQQRDNVQVYNVEIAPSRRYAIVRIDADYRISDVRVIEGLQLAGMDPTGTLTSKYQAGRLGGRTGSALVSTTDTPGFVDEFAPSDDLDAAVLRSMSPTSAPTRGAILTIAGIYERVQGLVGLELPYAAGERTRGEHLHRAVCRALSLGDYADSGRFPDIVNQCLEVKLQTSPTVDLGLVLPTSDGPATTLSPRLVHSDVRYLVTYGTRDDDVVRVTSVVLSTGRDFFTEFRQFGGLGRNRKRQIPLPRGFFQSEQPVDERV